MKPTNSSKSSSRWKIELIENNRIILVTMNSNPGNYLNEQSLYDFTSMIDEISDCKNENKYGKYKPLILISDRKNIFSAGMDLKRVLETDDERTTKQLFTLFSKTMGKWTSLPRKTVTIIDGHTIAGGFFIGLGSDVRVGLNQDQIKIGVNEIHCGIPFPAITYMMFKHKLSPSANWELLLQGKIYTPKEMYQKFHYLNHLENTREECMKKAIEEALNVKENCMEAYLSVKKHLAREILEPTQRMEEELISEFSRVRCCDLSRQRMREIVQEFGSNKRSQNQNKAKL